jgi:hypothetical protein
VALLTGGEDKSSMLVAEGLSQSTITERLNGPTAEWLLGLLNECDPGALVDSRTTLMKSVTFEILETAHEDVTCRPVRPLVGDQRMQAAIICIWSDPALPRGGLLASTISDPWRGGGRLLVFSSILRHCRGVLRGPCRSGGGGSNLVHLPVMNQDDEVDLRDDRVSLAINLRPGHQSPTEEAYQGCGLVMVSSFSSMS